MWNLLKVPAVGGRGCILQSLGLERWHLENSNLAKRRGKSAVGIKKELTRKLKTLGNWETLKAVQRKEQTSANPGSQKGGFCLHRHNPQKKIKVRPQIFCWVGFNRTQTAEGNQTWECITGGQVLTKAIYTIVRVFMPYLNFNPQQQKRNKKIQGNQTPPQTQRRKL